MKIIFVFILVISSLLCSCTNDSVQSTANKENKDEINIESFNKEKTVEETPQPQVEKLPLEGKVIVVDAGHGISSYNKQEPIAPDSTKTKNAFVSGTRGKNQTEEQLNLKVSKKLEVLLRELGADVHMTRTEHKTDKSNVDRAQFANNLNADLSVKIHADGSGTSSAKGISMLVPANKHIPQDVYLLSKIAGGMILEEVINETNGINKGVVERSDMTGFNWSEVPVVLLEMGFMTNPEEDALLETEDYQSKIAQGVAKGVIKYFERND